MEKFSNQDNNSTYDSIEDKSIRASSSYINNSSKNKKNKKIKNINDLW